MRTAVVAITKGGVAIGSKLSTALDGARLIVPRKLAAPGARLYDGPLSAQVGRIFRAHDALVLILPVGAAVRLLAPHIRDKRTDPAVVAVDDAGKFAVSLLSGHIGGANELAERVARVLGATPVVTTGSDVGGTIAVDLLGREFGWTIEDGANLTAAGAALVNGEPVAIVQEAGERGWWSRGAPLPANIVPATLEEAAAERFKAALIITDRLVEMAEPLRRKAVLYRPKSLVLGIGCDSGAEPERAERFLLSTLRKHGLSIKSARNIATLDKKRREPAIAAFAAKHGLRVEGFAAGTLARVAAPNPSEMVKRRVGTPGVCEPAALLSAGGELVVPKQKGPGVTLAVARVRF